VFLSDGRQASYLVAICERNGNKAVPAVFRSPARQAARAVVPGISPPAAGQSLPQPSREYFPRIAGAAPMPDSGSCDAISFAGTPITLSLPMAAGRERRHCGDLSIGLRQVNLSPLWIEAVLTFHRVLPMRAVLVAGAAAALGLLALANLSATAPPFARLDKALSVRAPIAAPVLRDPLAFAR
jgi:hypothetical protein